MGDSDDQHPSRGSSSAPGSGTFLLAAGAAAGRGRYVLERELGQGGMGVVWLALDTELDERVALKFVPPEIRRDADALDELRRETQKSRRLTHPNILRIHDFFRCEGEPPFICMEYVEGTTLSALKAEQPNRVFAWEWLKPVVTQLCQALDYAHGEGVVHRDLKPANMMLDARGRLKLADFGLAATISDTLNRVSLDRGISGTPAYMSPQQMDGRPPQATDDIYALGATLYELLTSKPPFHSGDVLHQARNFAPDPIEQRLADLRIENPVPSDVAALLLACLAKEPAQRPQSAQAVAEFVGLEATSKPVGTSTLEAESSSRASETLALEAGKEAEAGADESGSEPMADATGVPRWVWGAVTMAVVALLVVVGVMMRRGPRFNTSTDNTSVTPRPVDAAQPAPPAKSASAPQVTFASATRDAPFSNTLGMKFIPVPIIGGPSGGQRVLFCVWETRVQDYDEFVRQTRREWPKADVEQGPTYPAVNVSWNDVSAFCEWLTDRERKAGKLGANERYRLPSDHEWSCAVGIGEREDAAKQPSDKHQKQAEVYPWGSGWPPPEKSGNYWSEELRPLLAGGKYRFVRGEVSGYRDGYATTAPAGSYAANRLGLHDLGGNVWEWCEDWHDAARKDRVMRGGSWDLGVRNGFLSSDRAHVVPTYRSSTVGFRIVLAALVVSNSITGSGNAAQPPISTVGTQPTAIASMKPSGARWTNSLGMVFVPVPGTAVRFCIWETRKQDYAEFAAATPDLDEAWKNSSYEGVPVTPGPTHPVVMVTWDEVRKFARWLTDKERREGRLTAGQDYRLPTDLEWSAAVGLPPESGATPLERLSKGQPMYAWGGRWPPPAGAANLKDETTKAQFKTGKAIEGYHDGFATTAPVGSFASNQHGLFDLSGNVREWCEDRQRAGTSPRVMRGGAWDSDAGSLPADQRPGALPDKRFHNTGFRLVLADFSAPAPVPVAVPSAAPPSAVLAKPGEYAFTTLAGLAGTYGSTDGKGTAAKFNDPHAMSVDRSDNIYVAESWTCLIRRITPAGEVFTVAGAARNRGSTDGPRSVARFNGPRAVAVDSAGNLYVTDTDNFTVRKITPAGIVSTLAGKAGVAGYEDGKGAQARFRGVMGVAVNKAGIVYVADYIGRAIRQITPDGTVTTLAGNHADNNRLRDGLGADARFVKPVGLTLGPDGNLYVSETESGWIRKVTPEGMVTTIAGTGRPGRTDGAASQAQFHDPFTLLMDPAGNLLVADSGNHTIRKITSDGIVTTLAGQAGLKGIADGVGPDALFNTVRGLALDSKGHLYVSDMNNRVVRKGVPGR